MFEVKVIADSINPFQDRLTTMLLTYPRFIHSELMTHRVFSRNAASSRAIPILKMLKAVWKNPAMPVRWGKTGKGMQDHGLLTGWRLWLVKTVWVLGSKVACVVAYLLYLLGLHKQIANRVVEPWTWMTTLVSATEWENFFALRCHKDAQPEFQHLAYMIANAYVESKPKELSWGDWHIPFSDKIPDNLEDACNIDGVRLITEKDKIKVAVARAARTSYLTIENKINIAADLELHDRLLASGHLSPFEHVAYAVTQYDNANFKGWRQYRATLPNENRKCDIRKLVQDV